MTKKENKNQTSWNQRDDEASSLLYQSLKLHSLDSSTIKGKEKSIAVACMYEYMREITHATGIDTELKQSHLDAIFLRTPFYALVGQAENGYVKFDRTPWSQLSNANRVKIESLFAYAYGDKSTPLPVPRLQLIHLTGVFDRFKDRAEADAKELRNAMTHNDPSAWKIVDQLSILPEGKSREFVLFLIDYRYKKDALMDQFRAFLETRETMFQEFASEIKGSRFYADRLRDLANARLFRLHGFSGILKLKKQHRSLLDRKILYQKAEVRVKDFLNFIHHAKISDLRELEMTFQKPLYKIVPHEA